MQLFNKRPYLVFGLVAVFGLGVGWLTDDTVASTSQKARHEMGLEVVVYHGLRTLQIKATDGTPRSVGYLETTVTFDGPNGEVVAREIIPLHFDRTGTAEIFAPLETLALLRDFDAVFVAHDVISSPRAPSPARFLASTRVRDFGDIARYLPAALEEIQDDEAEAQSGGGSSFNTLSQSSGAQMSNAFVSDGVVRGGGQSPLQGPGAWFYSGPAGVFGVN